MVVPSACAIRLLEVLGSILPLNIEPVVVLATLLIVAVLPAQWVIVTLPVALVYDVLE